MTITHQTVFSFLAKALITNRQQQIEAIVNEKQPFLK